MPDDWYEFVEQKPISCYLKTGEISLKSVN